MAKAVRKKTNGKNCEEENTQQRLRGRKQTVNTVRKKTNGEKKIVRLKTDGKNIAKRQVEKEM